MTRTECRLTAAWAVLVAATLSSFWANLHAHTRPGAVAVIMAIAAVKVIVVLRRFMRADRLALPMRMYFHGWAVACAVMIAVLGSAR